MRGFRLYLPPFAPDDSGAAAVLYNLNAMTVIIDAGGCAGNILGFDEPRVGKSAVFSAGLRDMDAILGRDENLIEKISFALKSFNPNFVALVGTPVPAVIGTDYFALCRIIENKLNIPAIAVDTNGVKLYDEGISKTYLTLFKKFAKKGEKNRNCLGILGASHFDFPQNINWSEIKNSFEDYDEIFIYGIDGGLEPFEKAGGVSKNLVVSASGIEAAKYLKEKFDIPFEVNYFFAKGEILTPLKYSKILIVHEQFQANALRNKLKILIPESNIIVGTWFMSYNEYRENNDVRFSEESEFIEYVKSQNFDAVFADKLFLRALSFYKNDFISFHHFAVSGSES